VGDCECSDNGRCAILTLEQWDLVRQLRLEALEDSPQAFLGDLAEESFRSEFEWRQTFESASWHCYLAGDEVVAIARSVSYPQHPDERYVESFWIRKKNRHEHIARMLLDSITDEAAREGRQFVRLSVLRTNLDAREALRHLGFSAEVPERTNADEICLQRVIGSSRR
jgi:ribosomal protein S18 acetylase RimI-like enzyme